jgi:hypothetical protein
MWRRHVFSDLRSYICTFPDCDAPLFGDINEWFNHEMQNHRVTFKCVICTDKLFDNKPKYLSHVHQNHPEIVEDGDEKALLDVSMKPLSQIPAQECPCCWDWLDRLKERAASQGFSASPHDIITVSPTDFKRHLASHLEQLALFAVPLPSAAEVDVASNKAIEENVDSRQSRLELSSLSFSSSRAESAGNDRAATSFDVDDESEDEPLPSSKRPLPRPYDDMELVKVRAIKIPHLLTYLILIAVAPQSV